LWMRLKLSESPVFKAMKEAGEMARNPFVESFTYPGNKKRIFVALFGVTGILTTIWYTAFFSGMSFLRGPMRMDPALAEWVMLIAGGLAMALYIFVGKWSDRVGRKLPIVIGAAATLALIFPIFWGIGALANPGLAQSAREAPVVVRGADCTYDPFASEQASECGRLLADLTALGVSYEIAQRGTGANGLAIGNKSHSYEGLADTERKTAVKSWLEAAGYDFSVQRPPLANLAGIVALLLACGLLSALTYGSVAALLAEMFPPQIRYSSMSIPYHIGAGYLGGFLPLIAGYIVATTGNPYSGLWYTWGVVAFGLVVAWWGIRGGPPRDFTASDHELPVSPANP
jgi:MFS family permease